MYLLLCIGEQCSEREYTHISLRQIPDDVDPAAYCEEVARTWYDEDAEEEEKGSGQYWYDGAYTYLVSWHVITEELYETLRHLIYW